VREEEWDWELINDQKPIWMRPKDEITKQEYNDFYKALTNDYQDPLSYEHFTAEGEIMFKALLFVPT
jgi:heat shock protein beta